MSDMNKINKFEGKRSENRGNSGNRDNRESRGNRDKREKRDFTREAPYAKDSYLSRVRVIADYQFGKGAGAGLFPDDCEFKLSATKRVRYILLGKELLATLRANDGRLTLSQTGAKRLCETLPAPAYRVIVKDEVGEFVAAGKNAMAKHVTFADPQIRGDDEVLVCNEKGEFLATGTAVLSAKEMAEFNYGVAVMVRKGN